MSGLGKGRRIKAGQKTIVVNMRAPADEVAAVDAAALETGSDRSKWTRDAWREKLSRDNIDNG